jgi:hypothetical protein
MPKYEADGKKARRKNRHVPCIINERMDDMTDREKVETMAATYWRDYIAASEWPAALGEDDCSPSAKSRLKKKGAVGSWRCCTSPVSTPNSFEDIVAKANTMYLSQFEAEPPVMFMWDAWLFKDRCPTLVGSPVNWHPTDDNDNGDMED